MQRLIEQLQQRLTEELPGKKAHQEAAPYRKVYFDQMDINSVKKSGVLMLFYPIQNEPHIILIQRPEYDGTHSGQIAFPGGKVEDSDTDIIHTALREANEEVGVIMEHVNVLGRLTDVYIPVSNFLVSPVVGVIDYAPEFIPEPAEVADILEIDISFLKETKELIPQKIKLSNGIILEVPTFQYQQKTIWGATALILNELRWLLREVK